MSPKNWDKSKYRGLPMLRAAMGIAKSTIKREAVIVTSKIQEAKREQPLDLASIINKNIKLTITSEPIPTAKAATSLAALRNQSNAEAFKDMSQFISWEELRAVLEDPASHVSKNIPREALDELQQKLQHLR